MEERNEHGHPIYTLRLPGWRLYVVNANSLIPIIERRTRTISFAAVESKAAAAVLGTSKTTNEIMARDPGRTQNHFASFRKTVRPVLAPGSATLDAMFKRSFHTMSLSLDEQLTPGSPRSVQLLAWTGHEITMAGTYGEYGGANPFQDPFVEQAWLKFVAGLPVLVCGFFPSIFARQSVQAREFLAQRFLCYFKENHHLGGSGAVLARLRHNTESGMPLTDTARGELGACLALLNNTIPGFFWLVYHIFSDHGVLQDLREELAGAVRVGADGVRTIHVARVRSCCPILQSTVQEVLRFRGIGTGMVRSVLQDQFLDSQYLLKKGSLVFAPNAVQHFAPALWGLDCNRFNHRRFLRPGGQGVRSASSSVLRIFGGGSTQCPGRHFARGQLLVFAAMLVLRANIRPVRGGWSCIKAEKSFGLGIATGFLMPDADLEVEISPTGEQTWRVDFCTNV
ncbi:Cytochrome P450 CYP5327B1 [Metarhizium robertsii ARSEF 23]|uniref:Cytochrome P450 CYP5327B1 n=1 Tax=Metarhizium robertsii (strain ARSEF 23 / ATCC MYA-3075) TaxID=655844 RepID=E9F5I1_METRA|nr:Cytochrome P450 CYP5327B1 [Metarhizium robertsii ARSEF 23]EFY96984.1 Cytochrome P450 CYP5327B1 [Metarhizium robertsii ARSEF 23]